MASWLAYNTGCSQNWGSGGGGTSSGPGGSSSGDAGDARDILDILNPIRHMAQELFGVSSAYAGSINLGVTPNTIPPITTSTITSSKLKTSGKKNTYQLPEGFNYSFTTDVGSKSAGYENGGCDWLANPYTISHYDLFPRILNPNGQSVAWKGCVEARPTQGRAGLAEQQLGWKLRGDHGLRRDRHGAFLVGPSIFVRALLLARRARLQHGELGLSGARPLCERLRRLPQQLHQRRDLRLRRARRRQSPRVGDGRSTAIGARGNISSNMTGPPRPPRSANRARRRRGRTPAARNP